ncbi:MAG: hypothetical protein IJ001_03380 [Oscillospiraceae bacterium]|nr:hypothetical protein [Oscillospiraceae bacterium]
MKIRRLTVVLMMILLLLMLPMPVSANGPAPAPWYQFQLSNLPEGTVYVDLLIYLPESDPMYEKLVSSSLTEEISEESEIVTYCEGDYLSYTFHYRNALSVIRVDSKSEVYFFTDYTAGKQAQTIRFDHADEIFGRGEIRLAMLDAEGNILKISPLLSLEPREFLSYLVGSFLYDAVTDEFVVFTGSAGIGWIFYFVLCFLGLLLTCFLESLIAKAFRINKQYRTLIKWTNVISQLAMHISYIALYRFVFWKYTYATILLELLVYVGEFLFYRWKMQDISAGKCLMYTAAANTASLIGGLLLFRFFLN